ncbi:ABC transporter substrate-binding protein [Acidomonas methanolica]|uniref:ABC transporter ferrichrome transport n=2 Tax=Acidomonas methanolica TaxID=437 RepID=A0A023D7P5_ACIMT|nr:ABC transporter substrate-binding protein [Acidomonas methanolica]TCS25603.1 iron complex transport system substrate-binding protein [Acidomonas methanolica]GAJ30154.1 ABC transporter ferrichrome transport [Acidomonas methanolica NBRC 104435]GEK98728.1 cobalamin ABC transporter substrate-binding protein [Acidomonas methanolica NBRC 104435]
MMRRAALAGILLALWSGMAEARARRIVSLNLCLDQMVLLLADPEDIAGLSPLARDCSEAVLCERARGVPVMRPSAEAIVARRPDIVLAGSYTALMAVHAAEQVGVRVLRLPPVETLEMFPQQVREVARALGREDRAGAVIAAWERGLAAFPPVTRPRFSALIYEAHGYATQAGSLPDALLRRAGFTNAAAGPGGRADGVWTLERLLAHKPDLLVLDRDAAGVSLAQAMLDNPILLANFPPPHRIDIPGRLWICPLPQTLDVLRRLAAARAALEGK